MQINHDLVAQLVEYIHMKQGEGAILVFLPGWEDISKVNKLLTEKMSAGNVVIYPLHSLMPTASQKEIFMRPPKGIRKVVIATNIAETSITIDDVVYVVDCGKIKVKKRGYSAAVPTSARRFEVTNECCITFSDDKLRRRGQFGHVEAGMGVLSQRQTTSGPRRPRQAWHMLSPLHQRQRDDVGTICRTCKWKDFLAVNWHFGSELIQCLLR
jgi:hypothetical protein